MNYTQLRQLLSPFSDYQMGSGVSQDTILSAETTLQIRFPPHYIEFLLEVGWLSVGHVSVYGLGTNTPTYLNVVTITLSERTEMMPRMPVYLIPVMNNGFGDHYCLDTRDKSNTKHHVVFWDHEKPESQEPEIISNNFDGWLKSEITLITAD